MPTDLSVLIVSYNCAELALKAASSALQELKEAEVIIVDNASADVASLRKTQLPIRLIENHQNVGLSAALQQAYGESTGTHILILNPDTTVLPGSLRLMMEALEDPRVGGVGPRFWWDEEKTMLLPPIPLPTVWDRCIDLILQGENRFSRWLAKKDISKTISLWRAETPQEVKMLSGAAIMTRRDVAQEVGIFDPAFFLYYEDSDWCQRVRKKGYRLLYHPKAEMVHLFNQSGKQNPQIAQHMAQSRETYLKRHFPRWKRQLAESLATWLEKKRPPIKFEDMGKLSKPPTFTWKKEGQHLVQVGLGPSFHPAAGCFVDGISFNFPSSVWNTLAPGEYWGRIVELSEIRVSKVCRWGKP